MMIFSNRVIKHNIHNEKKVSDFPVPSWDVINQTLQTYSVRFAEALADLWLYRYKYH
jgi:hypothetical protein